MREELPMDYIDLLKRVAIPLGTIMVLSSALAQEQLTKADLVQLAVTLGVYDNRCEKLAPRLLADVQRMVRMLDKGRRVGGRHQRTGQSRQSGRGEVVSRASSGGREVQGRAFRACEIRKMADIDRTGGMMVILFIALAAIKFFG
jgi:hypothetical protein